MRHMIAQLYHPETYSLCHIEKKVRKKEGNKENSQKRFQKINPYQKQRNSKKLLKKETIENKLKKKRESHKLKMIGNEKFHIKIYP